MGEPYEIIMSPYEVYIATVGTAFPAIESGPVAPWKKLGANGIRNQSEDGVTISHEQTLQEHRTNGSTGPVKVVRTDESFTVGLTIEDLTVEVYEKAIGNAYTQREPGAAVLGTRTIDLHMGREVKTLALIVEGPSAALDSEIMRFKVPVCFQAASPKPKFSKKDATGLELLFTALEDPDAASDEERFGSLEQVYAPTT